MTVAIGLAEIQQLAAEDHHLAMVATTRADGTVHASVVNAGVTAHPLSGEQVVAFVTYGPVKLANLRSRPRATLVFRAGWRWAAVEGDCELIGPDDAKKGFDPAALPGLLRDIFQAAGGTHDNWDEFDRVMAQDRRAAVLLAPVRVYSNHG